MKQELKKMELNHGIRNKRLSEYWKYFGHYLPLWNQTHYKTLLEVPNDSGRITGIDNTAMEILYWDLVEGLNSHYRLSRVQTYSERNYLKRIKHLNKSLCCYESVWIGNTNVDLFFPNIAGTTGGTIRHHGLVIEIDGSVHDRIGKMRKDIHSHERLFELGIAVHGIRNLDTDKATVKTILAELGNIQKLDSRSTKRVWLRVFADTILRHATDHEISTLIERSKEKRAHNYKGGVA